jgi:hypothetical protein
MTDAPHSDNGNQPEVDLDLDQPGDGKPSVRHRRFRLRGEVFVVPHLSIEVFGDAVEDLDAAETAPDAKLKDVWVAQANHIEASIDPDDLERFQAIRNRPVNSLSPSDLRRLYSYLWEVHTGRPTKSAEVSSPGPESSAPSSKGESGSPVVGRPS